MSQLVKYDTPGAKYDAGEVYDASLVVEDTDRVVVFDQRVTLMVGTPTTVLVSNPQTSVPGNT